MVVGSDRTHRGLHATQPRGGKLQTIDKYDQSDTIEHLCHCLSGVTTYAGV